MAPEDKAPEMKWILKFAEIEKPLILNKVNTQILIKCLGSETDHWTGQADRVFTSIESVIFWRPGHRRYSLCAALSGRGTARRNRRRHPARKRQA